MNKKNCSAHPANTRPNNTWREPTHAPTLSEVYNPALTPLAATLMDFPASVANKRLTAGLSPLAATLTKNTGVGGLLLTRNPTKDFCPERPSGGRDLSS